LKSSKTINTYVKKQNNKLKNSVSFYCKYCDSHHQVSPRKNRKTCGSKECIRISRLTIHKMRRRENLEDCFCEICEDKIVENIGKKIVRRTCGKKECIRISQKNIMKEKYANLTPEQKEKRLEYQRQYEWKENEQYKVSKAVRGNISGCLKAKSIKKLNRTNEYLGCTIQEFKNYMEKLFSEGMSWDNHGEWHIDHIRPLSWFDLTKEEEIFKAFHYSNCQPLWAKDNMRKHNCWEG